MKRKRPEVLLLIFLVVTKQAESATVSACQYNSAHIHCGTEIYISAAKWKNVCGGFWGACSESSALGSVKSACNGEMSCSYYANGGPHCKDVFITYYCVVHGGWSNWGSWSSCTVTCGTGTQTKTRSCTNPSPQHGGDSCSGGSSTSQYCNTHNCPIDGNWSSWNNWQSCSVSCGGGTKYRYRSCSNPSPQYGGANCHGSGSESTTCNTHHCPIDGVWGTWQAWQTCTKTCGTGERKRERDCDNPPPQYNGADCPGDDDDKLPCNIHYCRSTTLNNCGSPSDGLLVYKDTASSTTTVQNNMRYNYFITGRAYDIDCCGLISSWKFYPRQTGTLDLIVWTHVSGMSYKIKSISQISLTVSELNTEYTYTYASSDRVAIVDTDRVGWRASNQDIIPYTDCDDFNMHWCPQVYYYQANSIAVGDTHDFASDASHTTRGYAINVFSTTNTPISLTVTSFSSEIPDTSPKGTSLWSYEITGVDFGEVAVFNWAGDSIYFNQSVSTDEIFILKDFEPATIDDSYKATMETEDSCSTSTATFSISVYNTMFGCEEKETIMYKEPDTLRNANDTDSNKIYMLYDDIYDIKCCGLFTGVEFFPVNTGTIEFIVFKHHSGSKYKVKHSNEYTVSAAEVEAAQIIFVNFTETDRPTIENGDRIGWFTTGDAIIPYSSCDSNTDSDCPVLNLKRNGGGGISGGLQLEWNPSDGSVTTESDIAFAIKLLVGNNTELSFVRNTYYRKVSYDTAKNTILMTYVLNGIDLEDEVTWTFSDTYLKHDQTNSRIKLKKDFEAVSSQNTYSAELVAVDLCEYTATATFSVDTYYILDDCGYVPLLGADDPSIYNASADPGQGNMYLMMDDMYIVPCCGVISAWEFFPKATGFVEFMVWSKKTGTVYTLKGHNRIEITGDDVAAGVSINYTVPSDFRIALEQYDRIGWRTAGNTIIAHSACDIKTKAFCPTNNLKGVMTGILTDGIDYDWSENTNVDVTKVIDIGYGVRAHSADNIEIEFDQPDGYFAAVANHMPIGTSITDYKLDNVDYKEEVTYSLNHYYMELNESYSFVQLKNRFQAIAFVETHSTTLYATGSCDHSTSVTVTIDAYNAPPIIRNLPRAINIFEDKGPNENLFFVDVFDPTDPPDPVCCRVEYVKPQTQNFIMKLINGTDFTIFTSEQPKFAYHSINSYLLYVCCEDGYGTIRNNLKVDIKERKVVTLYIPPGWFYSSIIISIVPIGIMLLLSCGLLVDTMFFVAHRESSDK